MGCLLRGVKREQLRRGQVIIAPGSMKAVTKFQAQIYVCIVICISVHSLTMHTGPDKR
jgi:translation elongation factor EF-Tu-like GTPase